MLRAMCLITEFRCESNDALYLRFAILNRNYALLKLNYVTPCPH